jgi:hypothetical protein
MAGKLPGVLTQNSNKRQFGVGVVDFTGSDGYLRRHTLPF